MSETPKVYDTTTGAEIDPWKRVAALQSALTAALQRAAAAERENVAHVAVRDACFEALPECQVWGDVPGHIEELKRELAEARRDVERLNFLDEQGGKVAFGWIARGSSTGRGFRLHQEPSDAFGKTYKNVRAAIDAALREDSRHAAGEGDK